MKKELRKYLDALRKSGYDVQVGGGGHIKIFDPAGKLVITLSHSSSDTNFMRIFKGHLNRVGIKPADLMARSRGDSQDPADGFLMKEVFAGPTTKHVPYVEQESAQMAQSASDSRARMILERLKNEILPKLQEQIDATSTVARRPGIGAAAEFGRLMMVVGAERGIKLPKNETAAMQGVRVFINGKKISRWMLDLISDTCDHVAGLQWGTTDEDRKLHAVPDPPEPSSEPEPQPQPAARPEPSPVAPGLQERYADTLLTALAEGRGIDPAILDRLDKLTGLS